MQECFRISSFSDAEKFPFCRLFDGKVYLYEQATLLEGVLKSNNLPYSFYSFKNVAHGDFGEGGIVCPNTNVQAEALKATINAYYAEIASKLQFNS